MPNKRQPLTFTELDEVQPKGRGAILRTPEEVEAEQRLLERQEPIQPADQQISPSDEEDELQRAPVEHTRRTQPPENPRKTSSRASVKASKQASMLACLLALTLARLLVFLGFSGGCVRLVCSTGARCNSSSSSDGEIC